MADTLVKKRKIPIKHGDRFAINTVTGEKLDYEDGKTDKMEEEESYLKYKMCTLNIGDKIVYAFNKDWD